MIDRPYYLQRLIRNMWNGEVKVITGLRRCGKSVLLFDLFDKYLRNTGVEKSQILKFSLDQRKHYKFRNPIILCEYVESIVNDNPSTKFYLFIDEVQFTVKVRDEKNGGIEVSIYDMLNELRNHKNLDVYVTGSNSKMLSKDIATEFRGRATQIQTYPLSFEEYCSGFDGDPRTALDQYMLFGGMPRITALSDSIERKAYLTLLFRELYIKDIVERNNLDREDILEVILDYLASQIGSLTNPTGIANALTSVRRNKIYPELVTDYLEHLQDAFLVDVAKRYDVKGKRYFNYPNKYYYTDVGLRNARLSYRQFDPGHIMENIIYNDLARRGLSVDVGAVTERKHSQKIAREIDFVVNDGDRRIYIQSAYRMDDVNKQASELQSLKLTGDFFKKFVVRMDVPHQFYDTHGILHCNLIDFLLGKIELQ